MIARPPESSSSVPKVIARTAGLRLKTLTIAVPSWMFFVLSASSVSMLKASRPQASATHADSTPRSSAIFTRSTSAARSVGDAGKADLDAEALRHDVLPFPLSRDVTDGHKCFD